MNELFPPSLDDQISCVTREIAMRRRVYARWVDQGRMKQRDADREINCMQAVLTTLQELSGRGMSNEE